MGGRVGGAGPRRRPLGRSRGPPESPPARGSAPLRRAALRSLGRVPGLGRAGPGRAGRRRPLAGMAVEEEGLRVFQSVKIKIGERRGLGPAGAPTRPDPTPSRGPAMRRQRPASSRARARARLPHLPGVSGPARPPSRSPAPPAAAAAAAAFLPPDPPLPRLPGQPSVRPSVVVQVDAVCACACACVCARARVHTPGWTGTGL